MELLVLILHVCRSYHAVFEDSHHLSGVHLVGPLFVDNQQVLRDIIKAILKDGSPLVPQPELFFALRGKLIEVNCPVSHRVGNSLSQLGLFSSISGGDSSQVDSEVLIVQEEKVRELL